MIPPKQLFHLLRICRVLVKNGLDEFVDEVHLFRPYRWVLRLFPWTWFRQYEAPRAVRLRKSLEDLGPVFVKFGQILSTRPDLLPEDIAAELSKLQDQVPPFPGDEAKRIIENSYQDTLDRHFAEFDLEPMASASVAQAHRATLLDGTRVVVKVIRPGIEPVIQRDLDLLYTIAMLAERYWSEGPRLHPLEVIGDYDKTIHDELNMMREAGNASQLRHNFESSDLIHVPQVYWEHTRRNVLVLEEIDGISIREVEKLKQAGISMRQLAHNGVEIFFTQAFRDGFFHADMHPGNIFVGSSGQYRAVDFGIMGTLMDADKQYLAENFLAFFNRDYKGVAEAHRRAGWIPPGTRIDEFEGAIRTVCEPIFAKPISEISFGRFLVELFRTARRFQMPIQPQLVLLQKTLLNIEGLGRQLYPQLDLWETAKPFLEKWMKDQTGPRAAFRALRRQWPKLSAAAPEMPMLIHEYLSRVRDTELSLEKQRLEMQKTRIQNRKNYRRQFSLILGCTLILGATVVTALDGNAPMMIGKLPLMSWFLGGLGLLVIIAAWPSKD